jgi:hypothetical protein
MYYKSLFPTAKPADLGPYVRELTAGLSKRGRLAPLRGQIAEMLAGVHEEMPDITAAAVLSFLDSVTAAKA